MRRTDRNIVRHTPIEKERDRDRLRQTEERYRKRENEIVVYSELEIVCVWCVCVFDVCKKDILLVGDSVCV